jgi:hypothetical protein
MTRFVAQHPFLVGAVLVSGPLAYCVGTALIGLLTDATRPIALPLVFIGLWLVYMVWWMYTLYHITRVDRRRGFPVTRRHSDRMRKHFSRFDPHSN